MTIDNFVNNNIATIKFDTTLSFEEVTNEFDAMFESDDIDFVDDETAFPVLLYYSDNELKAYVDLENYCAFIA